MSDRLKSFGTGTCGSSSTMICYTYSDYGDLATKSMGTANNTYAYDVFGNLRNVTFKSGTTVTKVIDYLVDGLGRRVGKKTSATTPTALVQQFVHRGAGLRIATKRRPERSSTRRSTWASIFSIRRRCTGAPAETVLPSPPMASSSTLLLLAATLSGCSGAPKTPARSEDTTPPAAPSAEQNNVPSPASAAPASDAAGSNSAATTATSASNSADTAAEPPRRAAPVEIAVVGKHAGDAAVERVISNARTGLQNCYEAGLGAAPTARGVVDFQVHVTASGVLKKVESKNPNTMPGSVTNCMVGKFGALSFEPRPATTIEVKVTCRPNE